jgi:hypothetical protein
MIWGAPVIMGNRHPDHATIARLARWHAEQIKALLVQTLMIAARYRLLSVEVVAGDGQAATVSRSTCPSGRSGSGSA